MDKGFFCSVIVILLLNKAAALFDPYPFYRKIVLPPLAFGPDSVAFTQKDPDIAYVTISDGRVLKLFVSNGTFLNFAYTSPTRTNLCDGNRNPSLAPTCGKVLGLSVDNVNQILYAVDANLGFFSIDIVQGGLATPITNTAGGLPLKLTYGLDVDPTSGDVYFVDASQTLDYRNITPFPTNLVYDSTGRLLKYNRKTKEVTVILTDLSFPSGPAVSIDGTFVLIPQLGDKNILKYYIKGPFANTKKVLLTLSGRPRKIKRATIPGEFWVAVDEQDVQTSVTTPIALKFNSFGWKLITKDLSPQYPNTPISVIQQTNLRTFYVGSRSTNFITIYSV